MEVGCYFCCWCCSSSLRKQNIESARSARTRTRRATWKRNMVDPHGRHQAGPSAVAASTGDDDAGFASGSALRLVLDGSADGRMKPKPFDWSPGEEDL